MSVVEIGKLRIAIVHDWLTVNGGAEKVLGQMIECLPNADIFTSVDFLPSDERSFLNGKKPKTTFIQKLPFAKRMYRNYLPLMPFAIEQLDLSHYDLVVSSSHAVAKGILTGPNQLHICYCHTPIRYAWDLQHQYLKEVALNKKFKGFLIRYFLHKIRLWDSRTSNGVDIFISNSKFISKRIWKVYRRLSSVIYPPVSVDFFEPSFLKEDFYLTASRMVPYKKIDLIVESFTKMPSKRLIVIGDGPDLEKIKSKAGDNIIFMGYQSFEVLKRYMQGAKAFIFAAEEDFGITPVEAQACGTPVIAYGSGGALETIHGDGESNNRTGVFFYEQTCDAICSAVNKFEKVASSISHEVCRENSLRFSEERFRNEFKEFVLDSFIQFKASNYNLDLDQYKNF